MGRRGSAAARWALAVGEGDGADEADTRQKSAFLPRLQFQVLSDVPSTHVFILLSSLPSSLNIHALNEYFNGFLDFQGEGGINY